MKNIHTKFMLVFGLLIAVVFDFYSQYQVSLNDTINVLYDVQKKQIMTSSFTSLKGEFIKNIPNNNAANLLTGLLPGLAVIQANGEPGEEGGSMLLRGQRSLINNSPWVLIDGVQRGLNWLEPDEIESVTVLKDAAATSIYGMRGSNGIVMVTTKRGVEQPLKINFDYRVATQSPIKMPTFLGSYDYARLYNEALINDGKSPYYSEEALNHYQLKDNPTWYPDNDYFDMYLKKYSINQKYNLSVRGGNNTAKYYFLVGYTSNSGLYKTDETINTYKTNATNKMYSVRSNVDIKVSKNFDIRLDLAARMQDRIYPGMRSTSVNQLFSSLMTLPPNLFPEKYNGRYMIVDTNGNPTENEIDNPIAGNSLYQNNPFGLLNYSGYSAYKAIILNSTLFGRYNLNSLALGLSAYGSISYDSNYAKNANRSKAFAVYELLTDSTVRQHGNNTVMSNTWTPVYYQRRIDVQTGINYERYFGVHYLSSLLGYNYNKYSIDGNNLPNLNSSFIGRFSYANNSTYLAEFSFAYQGTEQFPINKRYGLFPSFSLGWNIAEENFIKDKLYFINEFKVRASVGLTGSDKGIPYFYFMEDYAQRGSISIGIDGASAPNTAWYPATIPNPSIAWEKNRKINLGIDGIFFNNCFYIISDLYHEYSYDILIKSQQIPSMFGGQIPQLNRGIVENIGLDLLYGYNKKVNSNFSYFINSNFSISKNRIINQDEQLRDFDYQIRTGRPIGSMYGLVALGLFESQEDIDNSPSQIAFGNIRPGDIKYKDINEDGVINSDDEYPIGKNQLPLLTYGLTVGLEFYNFDLKALFQGVGETQAMLSGLDVFEFVNNGKVKPHHLKRWAYYTDPYTNDIIDTRSSAIYPRLTISESNNNRQPSTFWLRDVSYVRFKTFELGYTAKKLNILKSNFISSIRIYFSGYNLFTYSLLKEEIDPEMVGSPTAYPIQRVYNVGVNVTF